MQVFLVDDSALVRRRLSEMLQELENVEVVGEAGSVADALAAIPRLHPDFVILDIRMPDGDGIALLKALKHLNRPPMVGMLTNYPYEQYRRTCLRAGADFFWDKSEDFVAIPAALRSLAGEGGRSQERKP